MIKDSLINLLQIGDTVYCEVTEIDTKKIDYKPEIVREIHDDRVVTDHVGTELKSIIYKKRFDIMPKEDIKLYYSNSDFNLDIIDEKVTFTYYNK